MNHLCVLCTNLLSAGVIVYHDQHASVLLHPDSAVAGHAMVVATRHVENLSDLSSEELSGFMKVHAAAERALCQISQTERAVLMKLGIQTPHLHLHIYPVRADADRATVMSIIDARVSEPRPATFAAQVREALTRFLQ